MRSQIVLALSAVLAVSVAPGWAQDAGTARPADAGPVGQVGPADAGRPPAKPAPREVPPPDEGAGPALGDEEGARTRRVRLLSRLARGEDELPVPIASLFPVSLDDEAAVRARVEQIEARLAELPATAATSTGSEDYDARMSALERRALQLERAFLTQPLPLRRARVSSDESKQRALGERAQAERAAKAAAAAAERAEAERQRAAEEARAARDRTVKALKTRLAAVIGARGDLAQIDQRLALAHEQAQAAQLAFVARTRPLLLQAQADALARVKTSTVPPEDLHARLADALDRALDALSAALAEVEAPVDDPGVERVPLATRAPDPEVVDAQRELSAAFEEFEAYSERLRMQQTERHYAVVDSWLGIAQDLRDAQLAVQARLPPSARAHVLDPFEGGLEQVERELRFLLLFGRGLLQSRLRAIQTVDRGWVELPGFAWDLARAVLVFLFGLWLIRRTRRLSAWLDRYQVVTRHTLGWHRRAMWLARNLERFAPPALYLAGLWLAHELLTEGRRWLDLDLVYLLAWWLGVLWLLRTALSTLVLWVATRRRLRLDAEIRRHIEWTSRIVGWVVFAYGLLHDVLALVLGRGVLFFFTQGVLLVFLGGVLVALVMRWRLEIAGAYLAKSPEGRLARAVEAGRTRWYGFFVALTAFGWVFVRSLSGLAREAVMSLEEVRKMLAFVFRKQLERRADEVAGWDGSFEAFPDKLRQAFTTAPLEDEGVLVDRFPGLVQLQAQLEEWKGSGEGGTFLLRGPRGLGKSTWLRRAAREVHEGLVVTRVDLRRDGGDLFTQLATKLAPEVETDFADLDAMQAHLQNGKKRVLLLDDFHRLVHRQLGGYGSLSTLAHLMHTTRRKVFWVVAVDEAAWRYLSAARPHRLRVRTEQRLEPWPEEAIAKMLMARAAASGIVHQFEDLVVDAEHQRPDALARASQSYTRLIWDYADGNPMVAAHFWLRSLVPITGSRVRVRLFRAPDEELLARLPDDWTFMLAALAQHETLDADDASRVLGLDEEVCEAAFEHLRQDGLLARVEGSNQLSVTVFWRRAVERYLKQRHLL